MIYFGYDVVNAAKHENYEEDHLTEVCHRCYKVLHEIISNFSIVCEFSVAMASIISGTQDSGPQNQIWEPLNK